MRKILTFLTIFACTVSLGLAQEAMHWERKGVISSLLEEVNSTSSRQQVSGDSLAHKADKSSINRSVVDSTSYLNSVSQKYDSILQLLEGQKKVNYITDTITKRLNKPISKTENFIDTLQQKAENFLQRNTDSLQQRLTKPFDKVNSKITDQPVDQNVNSLNEKIEQKAEKLQTDIQDGFDKATDGNVKSPLTDMNGSGIKLPGQEGDVPGVNIPKTDGPSMNSDLPSAPLPTESVKIPDAGLNVDQLKEKAKLEIPEADKIRNVKNEIGEVNSKIADLEQYEKELQDLKNMDSASVENAVKKAEEALTSMDELKGLEEVKKFEEQKQLLTKQQLEYQALMQRYQDKKLVKDEIARKSRNVVNGKIDKVTPAFKDAQEKIAKGKKINSNVHEHKDGKLKRENEMAVKPFKERLVPGLTLQVYNKQDFTIDWGIQLGYKLSNRFLVGVGGVYRIGVSEKYSAWVRSSGIYGFRTYAHVNILKGFYFHGEFESLHLNDFVDPQTQLEVNSHLTYSGYFGLGKKYDITKRIRGSAVVLYRAEFDGDIPGMSKINLRIGFDYQLQKRTKIKDSK